MQPVGNKELVSRYFLQGIGELNPDAIEGFRRYADGVSCTIESQIEEGDWVATSYTLSEDQADHMGIMISRVVDGKIAESHVVAKTVTVAEAGQRTDRIETARRAFN